MEGPIRSNGLHAEGAVKGVFDKFFLLESANGVQFSVSELTNVMRTKMKQTFTALYSAEMAKPKPIAPAALWVRNIARDLNITEQVVRLWAAGKRRPCAEYQQRLADYFGTSVAELFPPITNKEE